jgi:hypothetical protein
MCGENPPHARVPRVKTPAYNDKCRHFDTNYEPVSESKTAQVLELAAKKGVITPREVEAHGIHREYLRRLENQGLLVRVTPEPPVWKNM